MASEFNQTPDEALRAILAHLNEHGVEDKDAARSPVARRGTPGKSKKSESFDLVLDLHGMKSDSATIAVKRVLDQARRTGARSLLIIHGWGSHSTGPEGPVLKRLVIDVLEREYADSIAEYRPAPLEHGGAGATVVMF